MIDYIVEEFQRRELLIEVIDTIIAKTYRPVILGHLRRGSVQKFILGNLNLTKNNMLARLINERMLLAGYEAVKNRGDQYYRNIAPR